MRLNKVERIRIVDAKQILIVSSIFILHILTVNNQTISSLLGFIEFAICFYFAINGHIEKYLLYVTVFVAISFDIASFVTGEYYVENYRQVYSITMLPVANRIHFIFMSIIPAVYLLMKKKWKEKIKKFPSLFKISVFFVTLIFAGIIMGLFSIIINDNNIRNINFLSRFRLDIINVAMPILYCIYFESVLVTKEKFHLKLEKLLFSIISAIIIAAAFASAFDKMGYYGSRSILLLPFSSLFCTSIVLFLGYNFPGRAGGLFIIAISVLMYFLQFKYGMAGGGKGWIGLALFSFITLVYLFNRNKLVFVSIFLIGIFAAPGVIGYIQQIRNEKEYSTDKLNEALSMLAIGTRFWYENMPSSPKARISEFVNIAIEYSHKPYRIFFGKGFAGNTKDHIRGLGHYSEKWNFSEEEYRNNTFVGVHETVNKFFLNFGLLGLLFLIFLLIKCIQNYLYNPWILIGVFWAFLLFTYSYSVAFVGIPSLMLGLYLIDRNKQINKIRNSMIDNSNTTN
jgi:hypothetical protein